MDKEFAIVGGGIVGLSLAYGLLKLGKSVVVFDGGDVAHRASRGNFGLVWVQGKGLHQPGYAAWTQSSAGAWKAFSADIQEQSGCDVALQQNGGYSFYTNDAELETAKKKLESIQQQLDGDYPFDVLNHSALKREEPNIGPNVVGALLHHADGHVNPLRLLHGLSMVVKQNGADVNVNRTISSAQPGRDGFVLRDSTGVNYVASKVVLCAGLGALTLGPQLGFRTPLRPQRGQILMTERLLPMMNRPSDVLRQVNEGGMQIGASSEEVGLDDRETLAVIAHLARNAIELYPKLADVNLVRSWAALRIMSPDGMPIYQQSKSHPGAYLVTCHSGITLAAAHATRLPLWIAGHLDAPDLSMFSEDRFGTNKNRTR